MIGRAFKFAFAFFALLAGAWLTYHYPIAQPLPVVAFFAVAATAFLKPWIWPVALLGLIPVIGLAPWTGWFSFEELDLMVLAIVVGGYARQGLLSSSESNPPLSKGFLALSALMVFSLAISMARGFVDAGGFVFGFYQGYNGPMNSVRIAKSFLLALLLWPLMRQMYLKDQLRLARNIGYGFALGLGVASLATIWERAAFTGLLDFSTDYRTTGLFWEMHVGGAALDGWLVLTVPFAIWLHGRAKNAAQLFSAYLLICFASYACLTTFSRGVYLGLAIALPILGWLLFRRTKALAKEAEDSSWGPLHWVSSVLVFGAMALLVFPGSGYRGLLALLGFVSIALGMPHIVRLLTVPRAAGTLILGVVVASLLTLMNDFLPKGAYVFYAFWLLLAFFAQFWLKARNETAVYLAVFGFAGLAVATISCSLHWGGENALPGILAAVFIVLTIVAWRALVKKSRWPLDLRWRGTMLTLCIAVSSIVSVFSGGAYMEERFSTSGRDTEGRILHWRNGLSMLQSPADILFGKGLGRFPANFFFAIPDASFPGTYSLGNEDGNGYLSITGGHHPISFGDLLRVSQRLELSSQGPYKLDLKVRASSDVSLHAEICEKHLLYVAQCVGKEFGVKAKKGEWQQVSIPLEGPLLDSAAWYAPRFKMFSIGVANQKGAADVDDLLLTDLAKGTVLRNAGFSEETKYWFFSSDRDHLPWHAKNLQMNTLIDQGALGVLALGLLVVVALWRLNMGRAKDDELSPYFTAGIVGFLIVGMFDSLTDVPRLAFAFYLVLLHSMISTSGSVQKDRKKRTRVKLG